MVPDRGFGVFECSDFPGQWDPSSRLVRLTLGTKFLSVGTSSSALLHFVHVVVVMLDPSLLGLLLGW